MLYVQERREDEFFATRPQPCEVAQELVSAFYSARRETENGKRIVIAIAERFASLVTLPSSTAVACIQAIDDHYLALYISAIKAKQNRGKGNG